MVYREYIKCSSNSHRKHEGRKRKGRSVLEKLALCLVIFLYASLVWHELQDLDEYYEIIGRADHCNISEQIHI